LESALQENITNPKDSSTIRLNSSRFGELDIPAEYVWDFPQGLMGLKNYYRFALINAEHKSETIFMWLHSLDRDDLAIPVMNPMIVFPDYIIRQDEPGIMRLGLDEADGEIQVLVLVTVPHGDPSGITANLAAPLILQAETKRGWQVILEKGPFKVAQPLFDERAGESDENDVLVSVGCTSPAVKVATESAANTGDEAADNEIKFDDKANVSAGEVVSPPESA